MTTSLVGQKLGKYEIIELLGQGGMATVYKGYQRDVDRYVAVKVLPPHPGQNSQYVERFRLEARTIARLQHPHILPMYDYGDENDILYLVMAYVDGGSLSDRIRQGAIPLEETRALFEQIAQALDYAHRQNVIHRDIKPDNILLDREGHALLGDFGIVKLIQDTETGSTLTATGGLVGTPAYMSPEQAQGLSVDNRTDIYSLGIVVYEMLAGKQPFSADTPMQLVFKHMTAPVPPLADFNTGLPPELDAVMRRALEKEPDQRYASVREFYDDFNRVAHGDQPLTPLRPRTTTPTPTPGGLPAASVTQAAQTIVPAPTSTNPLVLLGGFAIIALLVVVVVALLLNFNRTPAASATPTAAVAAAPTSAPTQIVSAVPNFGRATYSTTQTLGDTVSMDFTGLAQPPAGETYVVWMHNTHNDRSLKLGSLRLDPLGNSQLSYTGSEMLPIDYNSVLVTEENSDADAPSGKVAYSGSVPPAVMGALQEILVSSPEGIPGDEATPEADGATPEAAPTTSLLEGALDEANIGGKHAGLAAAASSVGSLHTHAEHTINILRGTNVDYNGNGRGENPGRGYGVAYFTDRIQNKLEAVANAPTADPQVQGQVDLIRVCILNVRNWMDQVVDLESQFVNAEDLDAVHPQLVEATDLAAAMLAGVDLNHNGQVEPFEGECGLKQINDYGISIGNLNIVAGGLPQGD